MNADGDKIRRWNVRLLCVRRDRWIEFRTLIPTMRISPAAKEFPELEQTSIDGYARSSVTKGGKSCAVGLYWKIQRLCCQKWEMPAYHALFEMASAECGGRPGPRRLESVAIFPERGKDGTVEWSRSTKIPPRSSAKYSLKNIEFVKPSGRLLQSSSFWAGWTMTMMGYRNDKLCFLIIHHQTKDLRAFICHVDEMGRLLSQLRDCQVK